jgi:hypothetical protein
MVDEDEPRQGETMDATVGSIIINGIEYVQKGSVPEPLQIGEKRIIVADRGWVFVGDCEDNTDGTVTIRNTQNLRIWGTTKGLGDLVNGPIAGKTKADPYGVVRCEPILQIAVVGGW